MTTTKQLLPAKYRSPLRYPGGKQKAVNAIARLLPLSAAEYREPLVGGGSIYFHAKSIEFARHYWINDAFAELISFWQTVQDTDGCRKLMKELEKLRSGFSSAEEIKKYFQIARQETELDKYRQALLFFFFNRVSFSGTTKAGGFSSAASLHRFTASSIQRLKLMPEALKETKISCLDFQTIIEAPGKEVFLFLDPPYCTANKLYGHGGRLHDFDHRRLASILKNTAHKFLITYDDCPEIRDLYQWANVQTWELQYGMNNCNLGHKSKIGAELFISNY